MRAVEDVLVVQQSPDGQVLGTLNLNLKEWILTGAYR